MARQAEQSCMICGPSSIFRSRMPWWGGDLQTLRNQFISDTGALQSKSEIMVFPVSDGTGDRLTGWLETPSSVRPGPLIVLTHGLTGCAESTYIRETTRYHLSQGRRVLRLNLRGAGSSRDMCQKSYHSGCAPDLHDVLKSLDANVTSDGIFPIGFSLGGNILINFLARYATDHNLVGAATVSAPIEPMQAAQRLMVPRNVLYHHWLLRRMKSETLASGAPLNAQEGEVVRQAQSVLQFDNDFTAPRNGFADADDYYGQTAGMQFVQSLTLPVLMIHAENDPWIPVDPYHALDADCPLNIKIAITKSGGHVGFHEKGSTVPWHDRCIGSFLDHVLN